MNREKFMLKCSEEIRRLSDKWRYDNRLYCRTIDGGLPLTKQPKPNSSDFLRGAEFAWNLLTKEKEKIKL